MTDTRSAPIEEYGVVGNLETVALVAPNGSVDWFPFPRVEERVERMVESGGGSIISMGRPTRYAERRATPTRGQARPASTT